jgi:phosphocarrier protein HPr
MGLLKRRSGASFDQKVEREITILNRLGLHARPAAMFVRVAARYRAEIWVDKEGEQVNGKSIMGLMMLAAGQGSKLHIRAEGLDAAVAVRDLEALIKTRFNEE